MAEYIFCSKVNLPSKEVQELSLSDAIKDGVFSAYLPYEWLHYGSDGLQNKPPKDPLTIYFTFDVNGCDDHLVVKTSIRRLLKSTLELYSTFDGTLVLDETHLPQLLAFKNALIQESVWLDSAIQKTLLKDASKTDLIGQEDGRDGRTGSDD